MSHNTDIVHSDFKKFVPASLTDDVTCFVFYDNNPRDQNKFDITVCTKKGEVIELYHRNKLSSVRLNCETTLTEIVLHRNTSGKLYYLVSSGDKLFILKRNVLLKLYKTVSDVFRYEIIDRNCGGSAYLKVVLKSDAVPLVYNDNLDSLDEEECLNLPAKDNASPIILQLQRKLKEAKYNVHCNEKALHELISLRQRVAFTHYERQCPNLKDAVIKSAEEIATALKISTQKPWIKSCNKKLVIIFNLFNKNNVSLEDVNVLLTNSSQSLVYTTKIFVKADQPPFWVELSTQTIKPDIETVIICIINVEELKKNILSTVDFKGLLCYKKEGKGYLLPFCNAVISSMDTMGEDFDVLFSNKYDDKNMLAILSTTERLDLLLNCVNKKEDLSIIDLKQIFCKYLQMELIYSSIVIHRKSPYHILNGLMIVFQENNNFYKRNLYQVSVYGRSLSQISALLHHIYDIVPYRILVTLAKKPVSNDSMLSNNETQSAEKEIDYAGAKKIDVILKYIKNCMSENSVPDVRTNSGEESFSNVSLEDELDTHDK